jgi:hypothetical protein
VEVSCTNELQQALDGLTRANKEAKAKGALDALLPGGWVPREQKFPQVQEVEEVREAYKAAEKCTNGSNCGNGTKYTKLRKKEQLLGTRAGIKKDSYLLPGLNQGVCKRANIKLCIPIPHMPRVVGVYLTSGKALMAIR